MIPEGGVNVEEHDTAASQKQFSRVDQKTISHSDQQMQDTDLKEDDYLNFSACKAVLQSEVSTDTFKR